LTSKNLEINLSFRTQKFFETLLPARRLITQEGGLLQRERESIGKHSTNPSGVSAPMFFRSFGSF